MIKAYEHVNNPANQPFNVGARKNKTKNRLQAWWGHPPYNNNANRPKVKSVLDKNDK